MTDTFVSRLLIEGRRASGVEVLRGERIEAAGPADTVKVPERARVVAMPQTTLLPGLIDAHSHILLLVEKVACLILKLSIVVTNLLQVTILTIHCNSSLNNNMSRHYHRRLKSYL